MAAKDYRVNRSLKSLGLLAPAAVAMRRRAAAAASGGTARPNLASNTSTVGAIGRPAGAARAASAARCSGARSTW